MKHVELVCEMTISIHQNEVINKKLALDSVMDRHKLTPEQTRKAISKTVTAINRVRRMFPSLSQTRFRQISDYYTLVVLISKFEAERLILTDKRRNRLANDLLVAFSNGVDGVRELQKKAKGSKPNQELYRDYLVTVLRGTDEITQRRHREDILRGLLHNLFERRDSERLFSAEQRRILWNSLENRTCRSCNKALTWADFTIDHIKPYSKGGKTELANAALMCRQHNSAKGNRLR